MSVYRIYVEKKEEFAVEAAQLAKDIRIFLRISHLDRIRVLNRYDVEGIGQELFERCRNTVFSEPQVDVTYEAIPDSSNTIAVEYLPGQYDQRADSCAQCIQIVSQEQRPAVRTARIFLLYGNLTDEDILSIKRYLINPVEAREGFSFRIYNAGGRIRYPAAGAGRRRFSRRWEPMNVPSSYRKTGLAMDEADLVCCQRIFSGRAPRTDND